MHAHFQGAHLLLVSPYYRKNALRQMVEDEEKYCGRHHSEEMIWQKQGTDHTEDKFSFFSFKNADLITQIAIT